jgi:hypothetical protein
MVKIRMEDSKRASGAYHGRHFKPDLRQTTPWLSLASPVLENMDVALGFGMVWWRRKNTRTEPIDTADGTFLFHEEKDEVLEIDGKEGNQGISLFSTCQ